LKPEGWNLIDNAMLNAVEGSLCRNRGNKEIEDYGDPNAKLLRRNRGTGTLKKKTELGTLDRTFLSEGEGSELGLGK
jgi:hypothetical protein